MNILLMLPLRKCELLYMPDVGLGYLVTALRGKAGNDVSIDLKIDDLNLSDEQFKDFLTSHSYDVIGMKIHAVAVGSAQRTIRLIRQWSPKSVIVLGGPQPTGDAENILNYIPADYAFEGEAEIGFPLFIKELLDNRLNSDNCRKIPGLIWRENGSIHCNPPTEAQDLDVLGSPAWDLMEPKRFTNHHGRYSKHSLAAPVFTTRGCPFKCVFCSLGSSKFRKRSIDLVLSELKILHDVYEIKEFNVLDANCAYEKKHIIDFCKALISKGPHIPWRVPGGIRLTSISEEVLEWMKKSGCYQIWVGIESGSERVLKQIKKGLSLDEVERKVRLIKKFGIDVGGFFVIGFPGETKKEIDATVALAKKLPLSYATFAIYCPEAGSELYNELKKQGRLNDLNFNELDARKYRNNFSEYSGDELAKFRDRAVLFFYLRPKILINLLKDFSTPKNFVKLLRYSVHFIFHRDSW